MKFSRDERLDIGRQIYEGKFTTAAAAELYGINYYTARDYLREYKALIKVSVPRKSKEDETAYADTLRKQFRELPHEQLVEEVVRLKLLEARFNKKKSAKKRSKRKSTAKRKAK